MGEEEFERLLGFTWTQANYGLMALERNKTAGKMVDAFFAECRRVREAEQYEHNKAVDLLDVLHAKDAEIAALRQRLTNAKRLILQEAYDEAIAELEGQ